MYKRTRNFCEKVINYINMSDITNDSVELDNEGMIGKPNATSMRASLALAETLARADLMTSPAAKRRLAARRLEMGTDGDGGGFGDYVPPKQLLLYLVRMGSFNSAPKIPNNDTQDNDLVIPQNLTNSALVEHCKGQRRNLPPLIPREFIKTSRNDNAITDGVRLSKLNLVSKACGQPTTGPNSFRLLQWNILSQSLGQSNDGFVRCPADALDWSSRKYNIVQGIVEYSPDIICLQEVDHFNFFRRMLATQGYEGVFFPKPDSPCLYIDGNNGPDGCAIFHRVAKFDLVRVETRVLEVWRVKSNQVAIVAILRSKETGQEVCVGTTHLKARSGALLAKLRDEQGKDLLDFVEKVASGEDGERPTILCGDFNAEPVEPIYRTVLNNTTLGLASAYANLEPGRETEHHTSSTREPPYTTWKIREDGEECHTIDYIFYSHRNMSVESTLQFPTGEEIGINRLPSYTYPSDHFSLVCDFRIENNSSEEN